jgi:hypothetical protein
VSAGSDRTVPGRARATLTALASDAEGDAVTFQWNQLSGPPVALLQADTDAASFLAPDVKTDVALLFAITATANGLSASDEVELTVTADRPPRVAAGSDQAVPGRTPVTLTAVGSDADGDVVSFLWTQLSGVPVALSDADTAAVSFVAPDVKSDVTLVLSVTATANGLSATDEVELQVAADRPPSVVAGADQAVPGRSNVTLSALAGDPDGDPVALQWRQVSGPPVVLGGADTMTVTFTTPDVKSPTDIALLVTATANGLSTTDEVVLTVAADGPPSVTTSPTRTVASRATLALLAQASDPDGDVVTFRWEQRSGPPVTIVDAETAGPSFIAPSVVAPTLLRLEVTAAANGLTAHAEVEVSVEAEATPVADAGPDLTVPGRTAVVLRGAGSVPDGSAVTWAWTQIAGPAVMLAGAATAAPSFDAPDVKQPAVLTFQLEVSAHGQTARDTVDVLVLADAAPVVSTGPDQDVASGTRITMEATGSDPEGDVLAYAWSQLSGPPVTLTVRQNGAAFEVPQDLGGALLAEWTFQVIASANGLSSAPAVQRVRAHQVNRMPVVTGPQEVTIDERTMLQLDASAIDADGEALAWSWQQIGGPPVTLSGEATSSVTFLVPEVTSDLIIALRVTARDASGAAGQADVRVNVRHVNRAPTAVIAGPADVASGAVLVLNGASSSDPDGDALTWRWAPDSGPAVTIPDPSNPALVLSAPTVAVDTEWSVTLTVTDPSGATGTARQTVVLRAAPAAPSEGGCGCSAGGTDLSLVSLVMLAAIRRARPRRRPSAR